MKILLVLLIPAVFYSQIVFEPSQNDVYNFISRLSQKGIVQFKDQIRPVARIYLAEKLVEAHNNWSRLTNLEKDELMFFSSEFAYEISLIPEKISGISETTTASINTSLPLIYSRISEIKSIIEQNKAKLDIGSSLTGRWRFVTYFDSLFTFVVDPTLGYGSGKYGTNDLDHFWFGMGMWGYIQNYFGYSAGFQNHYLGGKRYIDKFSPDHGVTEVISKNRIEYYDLNFNLNYSWNWGSLSVAKEYIEWGYGKGGNIVLSKNAPSFPYFRINVSPVDWFDFDYFHGWLSSDVVDTNKSYLTDLGTRKRNVYRDKYYAGNSITFHPYKKLSFSLGNSVIYSDRIEMLYLIPVMLFKVADFAKYRGSNSTGDNMQYFASFSSRNLIPNTHFYGSFFIDEFSPDLKDSYSERNMFAFSAGGSVTDLPIKNLTLTLEYTKIYPFVYRHYIPTQTYENSSYVMGHWMGHNADQVYTSLNYRFTRGLQMDLWMHLVRKGEDGTPKMQYGRPQPPFLFGLRKYYTFAGIRLKYEVMHNLHLKGKFLLNNLSAENDAGGRDISSRNELFISLSYGLN